MDQYGYGGRQNPFDDRAASDYQAPPPRQVRPPPGAFGQGPRPGGGGGGAQRYNQGPAMGRQQEQEYEGGNVEMSSLAQNGSALGQGGNSNAILNECRDIDKGIDEIERSLEQIRMLQDRSLNEADTSGSATSRQIDALSSDTMNMYRSLTERVRVVKSNPESQQPKNAPQVGRMDRRLKQAIQQYQQVESAFRKKTQDQMARQYRIVRPDADESEVRAAVEDPSQGAQVFQQALMQSNRQGQARAVLNAVQDRQAQLAKIEQQMIELAQLFQDMDTLIIQQEVQIMDIEQKAEEVVENIDKGNEEIGVAIVTARSTRKKKWICLGIVVAVVAVIAIVIIVYISINRAASGKKRRSLSARSIAEDIQMNNHEARAVDWERLNARVVVPGADWEQGAVNTAARNAVIPGSGRSAFVARRAVAFGQANDSPSEKRYVSTNPDVAWSPSQKEKRYVVNWTKPPPLAAEE